MGERRDGLRVGVVGVGYWGSKHVRVLRSTTGVGEVASIDQRLSGSGEPASFGDLSEALPGIDAVVIATPPSTHADLALQAIMAGKHVLVEKPLATTVAEARLIIKAAGAMGVVLMAGHTFEHNAAVHKLRELVQQRDLGQLYYLDCARLNLGLYQPDVNVIADLAPHDISISNFVLAARPSRVRAWGSRHVHPDYEDVAHMQLDYDEIGVRTHIHVSWLDPRKVRRVTAVGSEKMAVYNDLAEDEKIRVYDKSAMPPEEAEGPLSRVAYHTGGVQSPYVAFAEPLAVQDQHFVDCVVNGARPSVDGDSGLAVVEVLEAAQISMAEQRAVELTEVSQPLSIDFVPRQQLALAPSGAPA